MQRPLDSLHLDVATSRFRDFFQELQGVFVERDEVLKQSALALLAREHLLITGPPGTAKSQLASLVLGRIVDEQTGEPSLFSRQFTESTVQTDLIGAIDFKTLMETGRTEHFTDEGLLGSVHAFLDEVFDGRDMLLRSTLNLLHEREFKQGNVTAQGHIECAFMTSNRYISEILETSRQSLLAFVDRLHFISFVPRSFSDAQTLKSVIRRHGGGFGVHRPTALLSVQDVDALQAATDLTYVSEEICDAIADLVLKMDTETLEARRHDPTFQPTRFFSARTAVQAANVLRAIVVYDKIFHSPGRELQVEFRDLKQLRFHFLLCGVPHEQLGDRIEREHDPRERRQLNIMRTEAEIFERCIATIPTRKNQELQQKTIAFDSLRAMVQSARSSSDPLALVTTVKRLVEAMESGASNADEAATLLIDTVGIMSERALRVGLAPAFGIETSLSDLVKESTQVAADLEAASASNRPISNWLRGRLLHILDDALRLGPVATEESIQLLLSNANNADLNEAISARSGEFESMLALRTELQTTGLPTRDFGSSEHAWQAALINLEDELVLLWGGRFRNAAVNTLHDATARPLREVLNALAPFLEELTKAEEQLSLLGKKSSLKRRVVGPRLKPLVERAMASLPLHDREQTLAELRAILQHLSSPDLDEVVSSEQLIASLAPLMLAHENETPPYEGGISDKNSYELALGSEHKLSILSTLIEIAILHVDYHIEDDEPLTAPIARVLRSLSHEVCGQLIGSEASRVQRRLAYLQSWWHALAPAKVDGPHKAVDVLEALAGSGLLRVLRGDGEALRLSMDTRRLTEIFPDASARVQQLRGDIEEFNTETKEYLLRLLEGQGNQAWENTLQDS